MSIVVSPLIESLYVSFNSKDFKFLHERTLKFFFCKICYYYEWDLFLKKLYVLLIVGCA